MQSDYGVPQKRRRYLLLASRNKTIKIPSGAYGNEEHRFRTVRDAIEKFPKIKAGEDMPHMKNHVVPKLSKVNLARMRKIPNDGGSRRDLPFHMWLKCHQNHSGPYRYLWKNELGHASTYTDMQMHQYKQRSVWTSRTKSSNICKRGSSTPDVSRRLCILFSCYKKCRAHRQCSSCTDGKNNGGSICQVQLMQNYI